MKFRTEQIYIIEKKWKGRQISFPIATASTHSEALEVANILKAEDKLKNEEAEYSWAQSKKHYVRVS